jgi:gluconolactonase
LLPAAGDKGDTNKPNIGAFAAAARMPVRVNGDWRRVLASTNVELIASGFAWTEGPVWVPADAALYFSDVPSAKIYRWTEAHGVQLHVTESGGPCEDISNVGDLAEPGSNGMTLDPSSPCHIYICQQLLRRVVRANIGMFKPGSRFAENSEHFTVVADAAPDGSPFNSPNDVVVSSDGAVWFSDPPYGLLEKRRFCDEFLNGQSYLDEKVAEGPGTKGVYRVDPEDQSVTLETSMHQRPNGLAFGSSPSGNMLLWVADSSIRNPSWTAYSVAANGRLGRTTEGLVCAREVITPALLGEELCPNPTRPRRGDEGVSDGFKIDEKGRIWSSCPDGFVVMERRPAGGWKVLVQIVLGVNTSNIAFGDGGDVWLTGAGHLWRMRRLLQ